MPEVAGDSSTKHRSDAISTTTVRGNGSKERSRCGVRGFSRLKLDGRSGEGCQSYYGVRGADISWCF